MKTETKVACLVMGLAGCVIAFIGVLYALQEQYFGGLLLFFFGFWVEVLALKTYVEEITK